MYLYMYAFLGGLLLIPGILFVYHDGIGQKYCIPPE